MTDLAIPVLPNVASARSAADADRHDTGRPDAFRDALAGALAAAQAGRAAAPRRPEDHAEEIAGAGAGAPGRSSSAEGEQVGMAVASVPTGHAPGAHVRSGHEQAGLVRAGGASAGAVVPAGFASAPAGDTVPHSLPADGALGGALPSTSERTAPPDGQPSVVPANSMPSGDVRAHSAADAGPSAADTGPSAADATPTAADATAEVPAGADELLAAALDSAALDSAALDSAALDSAALDTAALDPVETSRTPDVDGTEAARSVVQPGVGPGLEPQVPGSARAEPLSADLAARIEAAATALEHAPPPRRVVLELSDFGNLQLAVSLRGGEVHVQVLGGERALAGAPSWRSELAQVLSERGLSLGGGADDGTRERRPGGGAGREPARQLWSADGDEPSARRSRTGRGPGTSVPSGHVGQLL